MQKTIHPKKFSLIFEKRNKFHYWFYIVLAKKIDAMVQVLMWEKIQFKRYLININMVFINNPKIKEQHPKISKFTHRYKSENKFIGINLVIVVDSYNYI